jgi:hypothetical protein
MTSNPGPTGPLPNVYARELSRKEVTAGTHRKFVGGLWEEIGAMQLDFLVRRGLTPEMRLLDLGCGCLRGGVFFIPYLTPGNYYGMDANESLLRSGWHVELPRAGLAGRLPAQNLLLNRDFEAWRFGVAFDMGRRRRLRPTRTFMYRSGAHPHYDSRLRPHPFPPPPMASSTRRADAWPRR